MNQVVFRSQESVSPVPDIKLSKSQYDCLSDDKNRNTEKNELIRPKSYT